MTAMGDGTAPAPRTRVRHNRSGDLGTVVPGGQGRIVHVRYDEYTREMPQSVDLLTVVQAPVPDDLLARLSELRDKLRTLTRAETWYLLPGIEGAVATLGEILGEE